jgi:hypothetical protein
MGIKYRFGDALVLIEEPRTRWNSPPWSVSEINVGCVEYKWNGRSLFIFVRVIKTETYRYLPTIFKFHMSWLFYCKSQLTDRRKHLFRAIRIAFLSLFISPVCCKTQVFTAQDLDAHRYILTLVPKILINRQPLYHYRPVTFLTLILYITF